MPEAILFDANAEGVAPPPGRFAGRVLFDLSTSLKWRDQHAVGILRVERELAARLLADSALDVVPTVFHEGLLKALEPDVAAALVAPVPPSVTTPASSAAMAAAPAPPPRRGPRALVMAAARRLARGALRLIPAAGREEVRQALVNLRQAARNILYGNRPAAVAPRPAGNAPPAVWRPEPLMNVFVHPMPGDVLFMCGLGWDVTDWHVVERLRATTGLRIVTFIHDLIPIIMPKRVGDSGDFYLNYFLHALTHSDAFVANSHCSRDDFIAFAARYNRPAPAVTVMYLGAAVPAAPDAAELDALGLTQRLAAGRFALMVGTFEIRKNHRLVIELWHELVKEPGFDLDLVIVGMKGWHVDDVIAALEASPLFNQRIFWLRGLSDAGLSWLYEHCHVSVFPSLYEGWGLPVVESLQHRRPVLASCRGATPEAGLGVATLLDPEDKEAWRHALREIAARPRFEVDVPAIPNWEEAVVVLKQALSEAAEMEAVT